jgi:hypothetical protein
MYVSVGVGSLTAQLRTIIGKEADKDLLVNKEQVPAVITKSNDTTKRNEKHACDIHTFTHSLTFSLSLSLSLCLSLSRCFCLYLSLHRYHHLWELARAFRQGQIRNRVFEVSVPGMDKPVQTIITHVNYHTGMHACTRPTDGRGFDSLSDH